MRLRLKSYICSHDTFLGLKIVKNGYCGNDGFIFAWVLGVIFLCVLNFKILRFPKNYFFNLGIKCVIEKCVGCFLVYLFLGGFSIKKYRKMCLCNKLMRKCPSYWRTQVL